MHSAGIEAGVKIGARLLQTPLFKIYKCLGGATPMLAHSVGWISELLSSALININARWVTYQSALKRTNINVYLAYSS